MSDTYEAKCHCCGVSFNDPSHPDFRGGDVEVKEIQRATQYGELLVCEKCDDRLEDWMEVWASPDQNNDDNALRTDIRGEWADDGAILDEAV